MQIKRSAYVGETLKRLTKAEDATREQLSWDLSLSKPSITSIKADKRTMPSDVARDSIQLYDNPEYILDILHEFSSGYTSPVLRGAQVENNRYAYMIYLKQEMNGALSLIEESGVERVINTLSTEDKHNVAELMDQLITVRVVVDNSLKQLQVEYKISIKERMKILIRKWRAIGWL